ncbi:MAG: hypothetical protein ACRD03_02835 [Acidimicrobiales bacterium]
MSRDLWPAVRYAAVLLSVACAFAGYTLALGAGIGVAVVGYGVDCWYEAELSRAHKAKRAAERREQLAMWQADELARDRDDAWAAVFHLDGRERQS